MLFGWNIILLTLNFTMWTIAHTWFFLDMSISLPRSHLRRQRKRHSKLLKSLQRRKHHQRKRLVCCKSPLAITIFPIYTDCNLLLHSPLRSHQRSRQRSHPRRRRSQKIEGCMTWRVVDNDRVELLWRKGSILKDNKGVEKSNWNSLNMY